MCCTLWTPFFLRVGQDGLLAFNRPPNFFFFSCFVSHHPFLFSLPRFFPESCFFRASFPHGGRLLTVFCLGPSFFFVPPGSAFWLCLSPFPFKPPSFLVVFAPPLMGPTTAFGFPIELIRQDAFFSSFSVCPFFSRPPFLPALFFFFTALCMNGMGLPLQGPNRPLGCLSFSLILCP